MKAILNRLYTITKDYRDQKQKKSCIDIASEKYNDAHLASFMTVFMMRPITVDELSGFRDALKELSIKVDLSDYNTIDIVGNRRRWKRYI
jgi:anthranilate phosphoribosyltransferase